MPSPFIDDGYTLEDTIPAVDGRWDDVRIRFRPFTAEEESRVWTRKSINQYANMTRLWAEAMVGDGARAPARLLSWDLKRESGETVEITADNLCRLAPQFFEAILQRLNSTIVVERTKN